MPVEHSEIEQPDRVAKMGAVGEGRRPHERLPSTNRQPETPVHGDDHGSTPEPSHRRRGIPGSVIALAVVAAIAGGLFAWSVRDDPAGDTTNTVAELQERAEANPDDPIVWQRLGDAYLAPAVANDDVAGYLAARSALERSASLDTTQVEVTRSLAVAAVGLHRFADGERLAQAVVAERPDDRIALAALIDAQLELGRYGPAQETADRLANLRPDATSLSRLSYLRQLEGDTDGALDLMYRARTAATGAPDQQARLSIFLAEIHRERGEFTEAAERYGEAMSEPSTIARSLVGQAELALIRGDRSTASTLLSRPGVDEAGLAAIIARARLAAADQDDAAVLEHLGRIRDIASQSVAADIGLEASVVRVEADLGDPFRAVDLADALLASQPDNIDVQHAAAWAAYRSGDVDDAVRLIDSSLRTGRQDAALFAHAAVIYATAGDATTSDSMREQALAIDPRIADHLAGIPPEAWPASNLESGDSNP